MAAQNIHSTRPTKISFFAKLWPLLLSALVLIIPFSLCLGNLYTFLNRRRLDFAILSPHSTLMTFLRLEVFPLEKAAVWIVTWILIGIVFMTITKSILGKATIFLSFTAAIGLMLTGYFFGSLVLFIPVSSSVVESKSFNLGYLGDSSGGGQFHLYECDPQGINCETVWQSISSYYDSQSANNLEFDEINRQVEILIDGELVYTHPLE